nr:copper chaperone PCu(A)C [Achromobacter ruhlandii]
MIHPVRICIIASAFFLSAGIATAQPTVSVDRAWVNAALQEQHSISAYMRLSSSRQAKLIAVWTPVARMATIHDPAHFKNSEESRPISTFTIPAGRPIDLKPDGYFIALTGLERSIGAGDKIPFVLTFEDSARRRSEVTIQASVRMLAARSAPIEERVAQP